MTQILAYLDPLWDNPDATLFLQLLVALAVGMLLGAERVLAGKTAGVRTHALVAMTATLTVSLGLRYLEHSGNPDDLFRIIQGIVTGIGFLGAGIILLRENQIKGLTTAAGLWFTTGIGIAIGLGFYVTALLATALALFVYRVLWDLEQEVKEILALRNNRSSDADGVKE
ncbi:MgtC/SapB family protein [Candidatus Parcubacteria bacterium]|nr:MAG: MgtC/SapB family protein [Candidatus Parcubacteria bacterium]